MKAVEKAEEAYECALASLRVLEQSMGNIVAAKLAASVDGADTEARDGEDERSRDDMALAAAKSTGPIDGADTNARESEDERSNMVPAAAKTTGPVDSADAKARSIEDEYSTGDMATAAAIEGADSEARAGEEEMKLLDEDEKIELETGKRKHVDDNIQLVKGHHGQLTLKKVENHLLISCR